MGNVNKTGRNSNLEILRIISMIFIISFHLSVHGFNDFNFVLSNPNTYFVYLLKVFGKIGVDMFILISAYFIVNSKFTLKKLLYLEGEVYFYSLAIFLIFFIFITPNMDITRDMIFSTFLPVSHNAYWFITNYIILMILSPFLNIFIKKVSRANHLKLIILLIGLWSILPTFTGKSFECSYLTIFVLLYLIGSYIRLNIDINKIKTKKLVIITLSSLISCYLLLLVINIAYALKNIELLRLMSDWIISTNSIFIIIASITLFLIFLKRKEFSNKYINYVSGSVLGVYLIHDNNLVRHYLWDNIINIASFYPSKYFILIAIFFIISIFIVCCLIDIVRRITIEKLWFKFIDEHILTISNMLNGIFEFIKNKLTFLKN